MNKDITISEPLKISLSYSFDGNTAFINGREFREVERNKPKEAESEIYADFNVIMVKMNQFLEKYVKEK